VKSRFRRLREKLPQPTEKDLQAASEFIEALGRRQVGFEKRVPFFAEHNAFTSEVKEEGTHRFLSHRVDFNEDLDPSGMLGPGCRGFRRARMFFQW
jgi:hypothetical protein